ncbi:MAG: hypothetical protein H8E44_06895 [Planctomycetes bacterium]|nr:hypothetical protein [Planctomycetota bacterium]MBL7044528.1 hypothetical protein [Pirellulaceae bacterium]
MRKNDTQARRSGQSKLVHARCSGGCGRPAFGRRRFLTAAGATVLTTQASVLDFASSLFAAESESADRPRVAVVYFRRAEGGGCVWPPSSTGELAQTQQLHNKTMQQAAAKYGVDLAVLTERVTDVNATLEQISQRKPDGLIAIGMDFDVAPWIEFCQKRGDIPTVAYANIVHMGRNFEPLRKLPSTLLAHTPRVEWLDTAIRLHRTLWDVNRLQVLDCPCEGYYEELETVGDTDEVKAIADFYEKNAQWVEPTCKPLMMDSAKHYVVLRRMMKRHGSNGVAVTGSLCVGAGKDGYLPACMALSKLLDEGIPAQCQAKHGGHAQAYVQRLALSLLGRPSYMGNITFDNLANRLILSHCTSALKLDGLDKDYRAPFKIRNFHANEGVSLQVSWPLEREATILDRVSLANDKFIVASANVTANNDVYQQPPCGGCRTIVEFDLDWDGNIMDLDVTDLHGSAVLGDFRSTVLQFCKLADLTPVDIAGEPISAL